MMIAGSKIFKVFTKLVNRFWSCSIEAQEHPFVMALAFQIQLQINDTITLVGCLHVLVASDPGKDRDSSTPFKHDTDY